VKVPEMTIPTDDVFFSKTEKGKPDVEFLKDHFYRQGRIKEEHALYIIEKATQLLRAEPNVLTVDIPSTGAPAIASLVCVCFLIESWSLR
jgi:serine/threonine-protein phosphatase 2B catalytic subunit